MRRHYILLPLAALIATLPLFVHGCSCGHDFDFHLLSWLEAASQFRHGTLNPHWAFAPAFNAGEPRFVFYPPLSWTLGALLTMLLPISVVPAIFTLLVLTAAGFAMYRLAAHFTSPNAALVAATLYIANPYMLFNAFERTAYAELLAAVWLPLLFLAALHKRPSIQGIALPVALLWLTNAPAAVMGCYTLALIIFIRLFTRSNPGAPGPDSRTRISASSLQLAITTTAGTAVGLALAAFYLIPAAYERRFVQIAMAIIPNMRFQDNFLFGHTSDAPHNVVLQTASLLAVTLLTLTFASLTAALLRTRSNSVILSEAQSTQSKDLHETETVSTSPALSTSNLLLVCLILTLCIAFLLIPLSTPLWNHLPELAFLQFPWRLLSILAVVLALAVAALLRTTSFNPAITATSALLLVSVFTFPAIKTFRQGCEVKDLPATQAQAFAQHQGVEATDEYTPTDADNDVLRADDPPFWLSTDPAAFAPGTTPNPAATDPNFSAPTPAKHPPAQAPMHLTLNAPGPEALILNLRDYPAWQITRRSEGMQVTNVKHALQRDDGLLAIELPQGQSTIDITWHRTADEHLGLVVTAISCLLFAALTLRARSRRIELKA